MLITITNLKEIDANEFYPFLQDLKMAFKNFIKPEITNRSQIKPWT